MSISRFALAAVPVLFAAVAVLPAAPPEKPAAVAAVPAGAFAVVSLDVARDNVTLNQLLPERIDSPRQVAMSERMMAQEKLTWDEARARITEHVAARRFGTLREFGDACAYLCSVQASFFSGQNLQLDGGSYPGLL